MEVIGIIPARFASTRFPGKALVDIRGKSMVQRVYEQASKSQLEKVIVATDNQNILDHVTGFGGMAVMTSESHLNGTERCLEALEKESQHWDYVVNIQGDEPFIAPEQINLLCQLLDNSVEIATLIKEISNQQELTSQHVNKVVVGQNMNALYFSRQTIPYQRIPQEEWTSKHTYYKHIGIYAYRQDVLKEICKLDPTPLELAEKLEQLRWLENGYSIRTAVTDIDSNGIDTPEDLERLLK